MTSSTPNTATLTRADDRRVRDLARDALCVMAFSVVASFSLVCLLVALTTLVH